MKLLTTADVLEVIEPIGISPKQFRGWCEQGHVTPAEGGEGHGNHRRFTLMQAVGIAVAAKVFMSEQGCVPTYVGKVVVAFGNMAEAELVKGFKKGRTHFITEHHGKPLLSGPMYDWVDVEQTYREVLTVIADIEGRLKDRHAIGRARGLAPRTNCDE